MSDTAPRISAVISVVDPHPVYFREAVASILGQTVRDLELVIIEEPSSRRVADVLDGINDPRIRHFCHPHRTSLVEQRNRGLEKARSDLVALLDADDVCLPNRFEKQLKFIELHPEVSVLGTQLEIIDPQSRTIGYRVYPVEPDDVARALRIYDPIAQPSVMLRKAAVIEAGGYQYTRYKFVEDYELWCRMAMKGYQLANMPEALTRYRVHPQGAKTTSLRSSLLGTIDVKRMYFSKSLTAREWIRLLAEHALLYLPGSLVIKLFLAVNVRRRRPG